MATTYEPNYQLVVDKRGEMSELFKRMDDDKNLAILDPYQMVDLQKNVTPDVINVTMNEAKVFFDKCCSYMNGANMQRIVYGKDLSDKDTTLIENFYEDIYYANDLILAKAIFCSLYGFLVEQLIGRGHCAARVLLREWKDKFIPEIFPFDTRYFYYETDSTGMIWGAFDTTRSRAQIERDYGIVIRGKSAVVTDFWDDTVNDIFIGGQPYKGGSLTKEPEKHPERRREHELGYPPLVFQKSGAGLQSFMDAGILKYQGESVFASNRGLIPELHRAASIMMTLTDMSFEGALSLHLQETGGDKPESPYGRRKITELGINERYEPVPINDVKNATTLFYNMLVGALQRGGLPNIDYGNLSFPLSAVAISKLTASKDAIFIPRLNALALFYREASLMIKKQYVQAGYSVELGEEGMEREYKAEVIDKKFATRYEFHTVSPEQDVANYAIGQQAMAIGISRHTTFTDIIKLRDPDGEINKSRDEKAEQGDIAITLNRRLRSLANREGIFDEATGKDIEAEMILQQLEMVLRQRAVGGTTGLAPAEGGIGAGQNVKPMIPLFGEEGGGGRVTPAPEEMMPPEEAQTRTERRAETVRRSRAEVK